MRSLYSFSASTDTELRVEYEEAELLKENGWKATPRKSKGCKILDLIRILVRVGEFKMEKMIGLVPQVSMRAMASPLGDWHNPCAVFVLYHPRLVLFSFIIILFFLNWSQNDIAKTQGGLPRTTCLVLTSGMYFFLNSVLHCTSDCPPPH